MYRSINIVSSVVVSVSLIGLTAVVPAMAAEETPQTFDGCERAFMAAPTGSASAQCFYNVARSTNQWNQGAHRLRRLAEAHPAQFWVKLNLAYIEWQLGSESVLSLMVAARDGFVAQGSVEGEISARVSLRNLFTRQGEGQKAQAEAERLLILSDRTTDAEYRVKALTNYSHHLAVALRDLRRAYRILRSAEAEMDHLGSYWTKFGLLKALADVSYDLGHFNRAQSFLRRLKTLVEDRKDPWGTAYTQMSIDVVRLAQLERRPDPGQRQRALRSVLAGLESVRQTKSTQLEPNYRFMAGALMAHDPALLVEAQRHLEGCLSLAKKLQAAMNQADCLGRLATLIAPTDPDRAHDLVDRAAELAEGEMSPQRVGDAWRARSQVAWKVSTATVAASVSLGMLDALEVVRELQPPGAGRIEAFSRWAPDYRWVAGRVLAARDRLRPVALPAAFRVMERLRARSLLEMRDASRARPMSDHPRQGELEEVLRKLARAQRRRFVPGVSSSDQERLDREIQRLERTAEDLREQVRAAAADAAGPRRPLFATIDEVRRALKPNEAMVLYQLGLSEDLYGQSAGGAWVWVVTRDGVSVEPIPDQMALSPKVRIYQGLFRRRDSDPTTAGRHLYHAVMAKALQGLSERVDRLFIVPDAVLHQLPFSALVDDEGLAVAERYAVSLVPSATFWLAQRQSDRTVVDRTVLAFVDPERTPGAQSAVVRDALSSLSEPLGRLPFARQEGSEAVSYVGGRSRLRQGRAASEESFKSDILEPFRIVHIAAHGVIDDLSPDRSALILAAGSEEEDGLLQAREILDLDFQGRIVILASCRSAGGLVIDGEGPLSLARTFLSAGADAVVGSRWPLRDDDALHMFRHFYAALRQGDDLGTAAQKARRSAIADGRPAAAWAGIVVLGDSSIVPFEYGSPGYRQTRWMGALIVLGLLVTLLLLGAALRFRRIRG